VIKGGLFEQPLKEVCHDSPLMIYYEDKKTSIEVLFTKNVLTDVSVIHPN
jgi:hypothetical protein